MEIFTDYEVCAIQYGPDGNKTSHVWYGPNEFCKTEAEAREAAELLKAFFEAKGRGEAVRFVELGEYEYKISEARREGYNDGLTAAREIAEGKKEIDQARERDHLEAMQIAELAAVIFAHNAQTMTERDAVKSAAKIVELARNHEK